VNQLTATRTLYGVHVPAEHFDHIRQITDLLVGATDHREYIKDGRRRCAEIALPAWNESKTPPRGTTPGALVCSVPGVFIALDPESKAGRPPEWVFGGRRLRFVS